MNIDDGTQATGKRNMFGGLQQSKDTNLNGSGQNKMEASGYFGKMSGTGQDQSNQASNKPNITLNNKLKESKEFNEQKKSL